MTQAPLRTPSLLVKIADEDLLRRTWGSRLCLAALWRLPFCLPQAGFAGSAQHLPAPGMTVPAGSGLPSPGWEALRCSSTMVLPVNFPFSQRVLNQITSKKGVLGAPVRTRTVGRHSPAPPQGSDGHGPISAAGAGLELTGDSQCIQSY